MLLLRMKVIVNQFQSMAKGGLVIWLSFPYTHYSYVQPHRSSLVSPLQELRGERKLTSCSVDVGSKGLGRLLPLYNHQPLACMG